MSDNPEVVGKLIRLALDLIGEAEKGTSPQDMRQMLWDVLRANGLMRTYRLNGESHD